MTKAELYAQAVSLLRAESVKAELSNAPDNAPAIETTADGLYVGWAIVCAFYELGEKEGGPEYPDICESFEHLPKYKACHAQRAIYY